MDEGERPPLDIVFPARRGPRHRTAQRRLPRRTGRFAYRSRTWMITTTSAGRYAPWRAAPTAYRGHQGSGGPAKTGRSTRGRKTLARHDRAQSSAARFSTITKRELPLAGRRDLGRLLVVAVALAVARPPARERQIPAAASEWQNSRAPGTRGTAASPLGVDRRGSIIDLGTCCWQSERPGVGSFRKPLPLSTAKQVLSAEASGRTSAATGCQRMKGEGTAARNRITGTILGAGGMPVQPVPTSSPGSS